MTRFMLQPWEEKITAEGKVTYQLCAGAWNSIRLKKVILDQFPELRDKRANINYRIEFFRSYDKILAEIQKMKESKAGIPMLLYLYKE